jgi:hypothetical protein
MAPSNNRGMTYQNEKKHLSKMIRYLIGVVKISFYWLNNFSIAHHLSKIGLIIYAIRQQKTLKMLLFTSFCPTLACTLWLTEKCMCKAVHPSSGMGSSNLHCWRGERLCHHGDGVCEVICAFCVVS